MKRQPFNDQILLNLDRQHSQKLKALLGSPSDPFLKGSIVSFKRRCGKKVCCCRKEQPHESLIISRWVKGKLKVVYTQPEDRPFLLACRDRWRRFRKDKKNLADLQKKILKQLDHFAKLKTETYRQKPAKG